MMVSPMAPIACQRPIGLMWGHAGIDELASKEKRRSAGEKNEGRRTEVRDPPREEDAGRRAARRHARIHTHMVDRHQHHDDSAHDVD